MSSEKFHYCALAAVIIRRPRVDFPPILVLQAGSRIVRRPQPVHGHRPSEYLHLQMPLSVRHHLQPSHKNRLSPALR
ncbi:hypothetical protein LIA77_06708 [Sarocladium implicatum]|nr:hypothetical protein LIA77_06708 [Sarocladium implicatum]